MSLSELSSVKYFGRTAGMPNLFQYDTRLVRRIQVGHLPVVPHHDAVERARGVAQLVEVVRARHRLEHAGRRPGS